MWALREHLKVALGAVEGGPSGWRWPCFTQVIRMSGGAGSAPPAARPLGPARPAAQEHQERRPPVAVQPQVAAREFRLSFMEGLGCWS
eukprot:3895574-Lingulodinium_polyedra.AAC.1